MLELRENIYEFLLELVISVGHTLVLLFILGFVLFIYFPLGFGILSTFAFLAIVAHTPDTSGEKVGKFVPILLFIGAVALGNFWFSEYESKQETLDSIVETWRAGDKKQAISDLDAYIAIKYDLHH